MVDTAESDAFAEFEEGSIEDISSGVINLILS